MIASLKHALKTFARRLGYEIRNVSGLTDIEPPAWTNVGLPLPEDPVIPGPWVSNVLEMANHAHRPARLAYRRRHYGEDYRLKYVLSFLDLRGLRTLELGPYEGFWSVVLEKLGVRENVSIEVRPDNIAKCRRVKELYGLDHTTFIAQNIEDLYSGRESPQFAGPFDLVFCVGLLYHLPDPPRALRWFRSQAPRLFVGTLYVEPAESQRYASELFRETVYHDGAQSYRGKEYREGGMADPVSGASPVSFWPYEPDLIAMLHDAGYARVEVLGRDLLNRMPHITLLAE